MYNSTTMSESWLNPESISEPSNIPIRRRGFTRSKVRVAVDEWEQMKRDLKKKSESLNETSDSISDDEDCRRRRLPPDRWDNCWNCCAVVEVDDDDEDDEEIEYTKIPGEMEDWKEEEDMEVESDRNKNKSKNRKDIQSHFDKLKLRFTTTESPQLPRYVDRSEPRSKVKSGEEFRSREHIWTGSSDLDFVY